MNKTKGKTLHTFHIIKSVMKIVAMSIVKSQMVKVFFKKRLCKWIGMILGFQENNNLRGRTENSLKIQLVS